MKDVVSWVTQAALHSMFDLFQGYRHPDGAVVSRVVRVLRFCTGTCVSVQKQSQIWRQCWKCTIF